MTFKRFFNLDYIRVVYVFPLIHSTIYTIHRINTSSKVFNMHFVLQCNVCNLYLLIIKVNTEIFRSPFIIYLFIVNTINDTVFISDYCISLYSLFLYFYKSVLTSLSERHLHRKYDFYTSYSRSVTTLFPVFLARSVVLHVHCFTTPPLPESCQFLCYLPTAPTHT